MKNGFISNFDEVLNCTVNIDRLSDDFRKLGKIFCLPPEGQLLCNQAWIVSLLCTTAVLTQLCTCPHASIPIKRMSETVNIVDILENVSWNLCLYLSHFSVPTPTLRIIQGILGPWQTRWNDTYWKGKESPLLPFEVPTISCRTSDTKGL